MMVPWVTLYGQKNVSVSSAAVRLLSTVSNHGTCVPTRADWRRNRLSSFWTPTGGIATDDQDDSNAKLVRAGIIRQAHSGIYHMLPLGRRIQDRLELLIDKHLAPLGASKLDLSSISSEALWTRSGRLDSTQSELFQFQDKKGAKYILSPTHEEEITKLVAQTVKSYKDLPLRLYQTSRKYRDEIRPRHGLLRSREFVMCDVYTFDYGASQALETYQKVRQAFVGFFNELKVPFLVAEADSGNMGGTLSHEFHFPALHGDDRVISCDSCDYVANEEVAGSKATLSDTSHSASNGTISEGECLRTSVWRSISRDRQSLINVWFVLPDMADEGRTSKASSHADINIHALHAVLPTIDTSIHDLRRYWSNLTSPRQDRSPALPKQVINVFDFRVSQVSRELIRAGISEIPLWPMDIMGAPPPIDLKITEVNDDSEEAKVLDVLRIQAGDACPRCVAGTVAVHKAIELGHTFHLGTRYSEPLGAQVSFPKTRLELRDGIDSAAFKSSFEKRVSLQMGCHGIGVSRMIGAIADVLADQRGLNWPRVVAPFEVVIIPGPGHEDHAQEVYDMLKDDGYQEGQLPLELVIDDRANTLPWKLRDADLVGYPVIVVLGRGWTNTRMCEVQCRRLQSIENVQLDNLSEVVREILIKL